MQRFKSARSAQRFLSHARRGSQHLQPATPPHLPIHTAEIPSRSYRTVARCPRSAMTLGEFWLQCALVIVVVTKRDPASSNPARPSVPEAANRSFYPTLGQTLVSYCLLNLLLHRVGELCIDECIYEEMLKRNFDIVVLEQPPQD